MKRSTADDELLALLAAVVAEPADESRRAVLADWLEEHGSDKTGPVRGAAVVVTSGGGERTLWSGILLHNGFHYNRKVIRRERKWTACGDMAGEIVRLLGFRKCRGCGGAGRQLESPSDTVPTKHCVSCGGFGLKSTANDASCLTREQRLAKLKEQAS